MTQLKKISFYMPVILLLAVTFYLVVRISSSWQNDPLHLDLMDSTVYAKNGFDTAYTELTNANQTEWDYEMPPHSGRLIMSNLPVPEGSPVYSRLSTANRKIEEFTVFIPFTLDRERYELIWSETNPSYPALYLASIGENWEIFLNGNSIAREIHLDNNGRITEFRSTHSFFTPFDRNYLNEGENSIVVRIIGARSSRWTGIVYTAPHYIGDSKVIMSDFNSIAAVALGVAFMFTAVYHLMIFSLRKTDRNNLIFALFTTLSALYYIVRTPLVLHVVSNSIYHQRFEYGVLYFMVFFAAAFLENVTLDRVRKPTIIYGIVCTVLALSQWLFTIWFAYGILYIWQLISIVFLTYFVGYDLIWQTIKNVKLEKRESPRKIGIARAFFRYLFHTETGNVFALVLVTASTAIFDVLDSTFFFLNISLTQYSYLAFMLGMAYVLARKFTNQYKMTALAIITLEEMVDRRTAQLQEQIVIAQEANQAKTNFIAKISHEMRTPMNAILGLSELALREEMTDAAREHNITIKHAGTNLLHIINDILDLSKIESGQIEVQKSEYSFASLLHDVVSIIKMRVLDTRLRFTVDVDCNIPGTLYGDFVKTRQIMVNLLSNAVKYTNKGFVAFSISGEIEESEIEANETEEKETEANEIKTNETEEKETEANATEANETEENKIINLIIKVEDSGRGIKKDDLGKLFTEFAQFDIQSNPGIEGTGLGLAITKNLVKAMGGTINVESEYGKGSTFTIKLPQKFMSEEKLAEVEFPKSKKVLVLERRERYRSSISNAMTGLNIEYKIVSSATEFGNELVSKNYTNVFIADAMYESVEKFFPESTAKIKLAVIAEFGESFTKKNINTLTTPIYSVNVADILNGTAERTSKESTNADYENMFFSAPEANVLVVDDLNTNLIVAEGFLQFYNVKVDSCISGMDAIEAVKKTQYDMVFMDHMMPEMDGIEAFMNIRALADESPEYEYCRTLPIVMLTANAVSGTKKMFLDKGFDDFISKPIKTVELNSIMEKWIPKEKQKKPEKPGAKPESEINLDEEIINIEDIDVEQGIAATGGTVKNYIMTLAMYNKEWDKKKEQIKTCLNNNALPLYSTLVHALKSSSANIGAMELSKLAGTLEEAGSNGDMDYIKKYNTKLMIDLEILLSGISEAVAATNDEIRLNPERMEILTADLKLLKMALNTYDIGTINEIIRDLHGYLNAEGIGESVSKIIRHEIIGEYNEAIELIDTILKK